MKLIETTCQKEGEWSPWVKVGDTVWYVLTTTDWDDSQKAREIAKAANFNFSGRKNEKGIWEGKKMWYTNDIDKAAKLSDYAIGDCKKKLTERQVMLTTSLADSKKAATDEVFPHPEGIDYFPFQKAGISYIVKRPPEIKGVLLTDDMGLGKTIQGIGVYNTVPEIKTCLIICPATLKLNWKREFEKWAVKPVKVGVADSKICPLPEHGYNIVITNYESVGKTNAKLSSIQWDLLIIDEAHYLKNMKTVRYQSIFATNSEKYKPIQSKKLILATGTPIVNCPAELWPLVSAVDPEKWNQKTYWYYMRRYCNVSNNGYGMNYKGAGTDDKLNELQDILRQRCMIRRLKKDVLTELPPKIRQVVEIEWDENDDAVVMAIGNEREFNRHKSGSDDAIELAVKAELAKASDSDDEYKNAIEAIGERVKIAFEEMAKVRHDTAVAKIPYCIEYIETLLESGQKIIIMAHHHDVIHAFAKKWPLESVSIYGETKLDDRQKAVDRFQTDENCKLAICSIKAAGVGITLTAASTVVFVELDWVPGNITQAEDRCIVENSLVWCLQNDYINSMILKKIQEVDVGDMVLTHTGCVRKVVDKFKKNHRGMVTKIEYFGWQEPLECTYDHKIMVKRDGELQWLEAHKLLPSDSMCFPKIKNCKKLESVKIKDEWRVYSEEEIKKYKAEICNYDGCSAKVEARGMCRVHYRSTIKNGQRPPKPMQINPRYVRLPDEIIIDDEWLYIFGWFAAEGFSSILPGKSKFLSFAGHEKEKEILIKIQKKFETLGVKGTIYSKNSSKGIELRVYSGELADWFREWFGHGASNKKLPIEIMELPPTQAATFLKGYTDGDGYQRNKQVEWVTASQEMCYQICMLAIRSGFIPTMRSVPTKKGNLHWIGGYTKFSTCDNKRMQEQDDNYIYRPIRKVETRNDKVDVYDLTVEEDHSFTVGFSTVHNCHRIGQTDTVNVYHLVLKESIDVNMAKTLIDKQKVIEAALDKTMEREPVILTRDNAATKNTSRAKIAEQATKITNWQILYVHQALKFLANDDGDYARGLNGIGYNKIDSGIGHSLAEMPQLSPKQAVLGMKICKKYKSQLPSELYNKIYKSEEIERESW